MKSLMLLIVGLLAGSALTAARVQHALLMADDATRAAVAEVKRGIVEGHRTRNRAALDRLYAESYTALDASGGLRTKADLLAALPTDAEMVDGRYDLTRVRRWSGGTWRRSCPDRVFPSNTLTAE